MRLRISSTSATHEAFKASSCKIISTNAPPYDGGIEYIPRAMAWICDCTIGVCAEFAVTITARPTRSRYKPKFLEHDAAIMTSGTDSTIKRIPKASVSKSSPKPR